MKNGDIVRIKHNSPLAKEYGYQCGFVYSLPSDKFYKNLGFDDSDKGVVLILEESYEDLVWAYQADLVVLIRAPFHIRMMAKLHRFLTKY